MAHDQGFLGDFPTYPVRLGGCECQTFVLAKVVVESTYGLSTSIVSTLLSRFKKNIPIDGALEKVNERVEA
jgi:hypothetical protein